MGLVGHRVSICGFEMIQSMEAEKRLWKRWSVCKTRSSWKLEVALKLKSRHLCISRKRKLVNQLVECRMIAVQNCATPVYVTVTARSCTWRGGAYLLFDEWLKAVDTSND